MPESMKDLVQYLAKALVSNPDAVEIKESANDEAQGK